MSGGEYVIATEQASTSAIDQSAEAVSEDAATAPQEHSEAAPTPTRVTQVRQRAREDGFSLAVNLQLQLPEFEDPSKYEDLFKALRKYLLPRDSE